MIQSATFQNFKTLADVTLDLGPLVMLVGPNGCGKTSILQALHMLCLLGEPQVDEKRTFGGRPGVIFEAAGQSWRLCTSGSKGPIVLGARTGAGTVELRAAPFDPDSADVPRDPYVVHLNGSPIPKPRAQISAALYDPVRSALPTAARLSLDARQLSLPSESLSANPRLGIRGEQLASVLNFLAGAHRERLEAVEAGLAAVVPGARRVRTWPVVTTERREFKHEIDGQEVSVSRSVQVPGHRFALDMQGRGTVDADLLSEGTLLALGLLAALHHPDAPRLFLLDDLDKGLHMGAQLRMVSVLRTIQADRPDLQIVATTHSPLLVDGLDAAEVRILRLDPAGHTQCRPLTSVPDFSRWSQALRAGELWASLEDEWKDPDHAG